MAPHCVPVQLVKLIEDHFGRGSVVHGLRCTPGHPWDKLYFEWMKHADVFIPCLSETYLNSPACCEEFLEACLVQAPDPEDTHRVVIPVLLGPLPWKYPSAVPDDKICLGPGKPALSRFPDATKEQLLGQFGTRNAFPNPNDGLLFDNPDKNIPKLITLIEAAIENSRNSQACPTPPRTCICR